MTLEINPTRNKLKEFYTGAFASLGMITALQPVFTIKTFVMSNRGFPPLAKLYDGYLANATNIMPTQGVVFLSYAMLEGYFGKDRKLSDYEKLGISLAAGVAGAPITTGFERAMTLKQLEKEQGRKNAFFELVSKGGVREVFKGLAPTALREAGSAAGIFGFNDLVRKNLKPAFQNHEVRNAITDVCNFFGVNDPKDQEKVVQKTHQVVASIMAGGFVGVITAPPDRIRTKMQGDKDGSYSMMKTTWNVVKTEGILGLFKGAGVRGALVASAIVLTTQFAEVIPGHIPSWMTGES